MTIRLAHLFSSDLGIVASMPYVAPLLRRGWEITFFTPPGPNVALAEQHGMRWIELDFARKIDFAGDVRASARLLRRLLQTRFDLIHTHAMKPGLAGRVLATCLRGPAIVHTVHGQPWSKESSRLRRRAYAAMDRIASLGTDAILCQTTEDLETLAEANVAPRERLVWIGNGVDLERFDPARVASGVRAELRRRIGVLPDETMFLSAGRLVHRKGFVQLFEAARLARKQDPRVRVVVAGMLDDGAADALDPAEVASAKAAGVIVLPETNDMPELYAASDAVVLASRWEGIPRVLMEGAAMGKPLVACDARGCREVVRDRETGLLVRRDDLDEMAAALVELARDSALRERIGAFNARVAPERWDVRRAAARVVECYDAVLAERPKRAA